MRFASRQSAEQSLPGVSGPVRLDRRTGALLQRLQPGDVAVLDHLDLDRASAEVLLERGVVAVVNASRFISGRYPNLGPQLLARSGVLLVDEVGPEVFSALREGTTVRIHAGKVLVGPDPVATGRQLGPDEVAAQMDEARTGLSTQLQSFTHNTTEFLRREQELLLHGRGIPTTRTELAGRPVVVVVRGWDYREDLRLLRRFIKEQQPVLVGVDAGADALLDAGHQPDIVLVGEHGLGVAPSAERGSVVSDKALRRAHEVVLHADRSGRAVGADRLDRLGVRYQTLEASGTSEDVALLLADVRGASLVVTVGTHATLDEFLDRQRSGLASTFLTRLRVGPKLVDAKGVPQLYAGGVRRWQLALLLVAGFVALGAALAATPVGSDWLAQGWSWLVPDSVDALASSAAGSVSSTSSDVLQWIQGLTS